MEVKVPKNQQGFVYFGSVPPPVDSSTARGTSSALPGTPSENDASVSKGDSGKFPMPPNTAADSTSKMNRGAATLSGILTDPQFRTVIRALEEREGATPIISAEGSATSGSPLKLQRPDGGEVNVLPKVVGDQIELEFELRRTKGEYAGFSVNSRAKVKSGEAAVFSDVLKGTSKGGDSSTRFMFFLDATLDEK